MLSNILSVVVQIENPVVYIGLGNILAVLMSWKRNKDVILAILAFLLGWLYVIYWVITEY